MRFRFALHHRLTSTNRDFPVDSPQSAAEAIVDAPTASNEAPPANGIAGLKHWRYDLTSGFIVSLISTPFSLGIAMASGAPPVTGIISAIIAGFVLPFFGGSYVTIGGPAAGLAPVLMAGMATLGGGDLAKGYPLLLAAILFAGVLQVILSAFKLARFAAVFPASVIEGMLCAIGLLIVAKQIPNLLGVPFASHDFWSILGEIPSKLSAVDSKACALGIFSLTLIFFLDSLKTKWLKIVPPLVFVVFIGSVAGRLIGIDSRYLIHLPDHPLGGVTWPHFGAIFSDHSLWFSCFVVVLTLTLIDGVESLATIAAVDKIDPFKRKSDPNRTLLAMGVANMMSSCVGGLTIIPGGVKSTANVLSGGRTQWANFYNSCFLLMTLVFFRDVVNHFPYPVLAAVLAFIGYKLCRPAIWFDVFEIGAEQLLIFSATALVIVSTDLLVGVGLGVVLELVLSACYVMSIESRAGRSRSFVSTVRSLFQNPIVDRVVEGEEYHLTADRPLVCFNTLPLHRELNEVPAGISKVVLHIREGVTLVDHTTCEQLLDAVERDGAGNGAGLEVQGWSRLAPRSFHRAALHTLDVAIKPELAAMAPGAKTV